MRGQGFFFIQVGDSMVNCDAILGYAATLQTVYQPRVREVPVLIVATSAGEYREENCSVEQFTKRLQELVALDD